LRFFIKYCCGELEFSSQVKQKGGEALILVESMKRRNNSRIKQVAFKKSPQKFLGALFVN
jgi:hypothetical protein